MKRRQFIKQGIAALATLAVGEVILLTPEEAAAASRKISQPEMPPARQPGFSATSPTSPASRRTPSPCREASKACAVPCRLVLSEAGRRISCSSFLIWSTALPSE